MRNFTEAELSADSSRLLVTAEDGSGLYALSDLSRPLQRFPAPDPSHHVEHAIFDRGDEGIVQFVGDKDETVNAVQRWTTAGRLLHSQTVLVNAHSLIVRPRDGRVAIIGDRGGNASSYSLNLLLDRDGSTHPLTLPRQTEMEHAQALSADGRVLAQAMSNGVLLVDMDSGQNLGPALQYPMDTSERIAQLAFSPDNDRLLARTTYGRWLLWNLTPDRRPADMIADEGAQVAPLAGTAFTPPSPALRASWRARDSATAAQVPQPSAWSCLPPNGAIPPRAADTPSPLLDLSAQFTAPLHRVSLASTSVRERSLGNLCVLPLGVQRFAGIDFDVRGVVELRSDPSHPGSHSTARSGPLSVDVAPGRYERVHVLGAVTSSTTGRDDEVGRLRWVYRDGGFRELPLRLGNADAPTPGGDDHTHVAWYGAYGESQVVASGGAAAALFATDIGNPEPDREIARIELRVTADIVNDGNLSIVAITLDPAAGALPPLTTRSKTASATQPVIVTR